MTLLKSISYSLFLLSAVLLSTCGQKGPLYIQESVQDSAQETGQNPANNKNTESSKPDATDIQVETGAESKTAPETESKK